LPRARVVPRPLTELDPETAKLIEDVTVDSKGRLIPKLYSKLQANKELRAMLNISAKQSAPDVTQLSLPSRRRLTNEPFQACCIQRKQFAKLVRALQCLGRNCEAAIFAPGSTTTVVPIVTRL
jgi:hypothetical protein